jgi:hypothetical protein
MMYVLIEYMLITYTDTACILTVFMHTEYIPHIGTNDAKMHGIHKYSNMHMENMSRACIWHTCIWRTCIWRTKCMSKIQSKFFVNTWKPYVRRPYAGEGSVTAHLGAK